MLLYNIRLLSLMLIMLIQRNIDYSLIVNARFLLDLISY